MKDRNIYTIEEIKEKAKNVFMNKEYIDRVYLFGSYAKNSARPDSDLDFVVRVNSSVGMKLYELYDEINDVFGKSTDILTEKEILSLMPKTYMKDRILIYEH